MGIKDSLVISFTHSTAACDMNKYVAPESITCGSAAASTLVRLNTFPIVAHAPSLVALVDPAFPRWGHQDVMYPGMLQLKHTIGFL